LLANVRNQLQLADKMIETGDHSQDWLRLKMQKEMALNVSQIPVDDLRKITAPTLIMQGQDDGAVSRIIEVVTDVPHAQVSILPAATHDLLRG
jgi:pimeloyl-ACP methyl ester carboxylesterase